MQSHELWLKIVQEDLKAAEGLLAIELFSAVTFHCQQAAEKSLKGYLAFKNQPIIKTHDLIKLVELCMKIDVDFRSIYEEAKLLNPFSTKFRYPTEYDIPDFVDAESAIKQTQKIVRFVIKKISKLETEQTTIFKPI